LAFPFSFSWFADEFNVKSTPQHRARPSLPRLLPKANAPAQPVEVRPSQVGHGAPLFFSRLRGHKIPCALPSNRAGRYPFPLFPREVSEALGSQPHPPPPSGTDGEDRSEGARAPMGFISLSFLLTYAACALATRFGSPQNPMQAAYVCYERLVSVRLRIVPPVET